MREERIGINENAINNYIDNLDTYKSRIDSVLEEIYSTYEKISNEMAASDWNMKTFYSNKMTAITQTRKDIPENLKRYQNDAQNLKSKFKNLDLNNAKNLYDANTRIGK